MRIRPGHVAVVTGGGDGLGRMLCVQLAERGVDVALCDISPEKMDDTLAACREAQATVGVSARLFAYACDVSVEAQCIAFRDEVRAAFKTAHLNLLFNNAGIGWGGSFITADRKAWDYCFAVSWGGVYNTCRAFMDMLVTSAEGCVVNVSSIMGVWASVGPGSESTSYCAAKFAIRGFTEALINDFRKNAPHLQAVVVIPGAIATSILTNSVVALRSADGKKVTLSKKEKQLLADYEAAAFGSRDDCLSPEDAARIVLHAVEDGQWRCLVGDDAEAVDAGVRKLPNEVYDMTFEQIGRLGNPQWRRGLQTQLSRRSTSNPPSSRL